MRNLSSVPEEWRTAIRNNGGGFINHIFYFITMRNMVYTAPHGELEEQVNNTFGDYESFMKEFGLAASTLFGSGYVWLVEDEEREISIVTTTNQVGTVWIIINDAHSNQFCKWSLISLPIQSRIILDLHGRYILYRYTIQPGVNS